MNDLRMIENELVPVYETSTREKVVYGTELYECLGSKRQYTDWIKGRLADCDASEKCEAFFLYGCARCGRSD